MITDGSVIADIDLKVWKEHASVEIKGERFTVTSKGILSPRYRLEAFDTVLAEASRPSPWQRRYEVEFAGNQYVLAAVRWYRRRFVLQKSDEGRSVGDELGRVDPVKWYSWSATASFSEELPLAVDVFLIALVLLAWQRAAKSN